MSDWEHYKWLWQQTTNTSRRNKIIDAAIKTGDPEALKWFWQQTTSSSRRDKIIDAAIKTGDPEALKWFWQQTTSSSRRDKIIDAMMIPDKNRSGRILPKQNKIATSLTEVKMNSSFLYGLFICHASEDKDTVVRTLATKLDDNGLSVWYDEFSLSLGDSLRRSIDRGLAESRYGVVVLSKNFFAKEWPQKELDALVAREDGRSKVILPIWHGVTKVDVQSFSPILADRVAASTDKGMDYVVNEILKAVRS